MTDVTFPGPARAKPAPRRAIHAVRPRRGRPSRRGLGHAAGRRAVPRRGRAGVLGDNGRVSSPRTAASAALFERARAVTPGGVNSPVRAFNAVGGTPRFIRSARGRLADRRRRQRVRRPDLLVGPDAARPRPPRGAGRGRRRGGPRHVVRHPDRAGGRARRGDRRPRARREGPLRLLGHRGHDVGDPAGPRLHRPRRRGEVRRLLPRPRRLPAGLGRLGARDVRACPAPPASRSRARR